MTIKVKYYCMNAYYKIRFKLQFFHHNGTIRTKPIRKIPRTFVLGIYFVCVIVMDFHFVFYIGQPFSVRSA